MPAKTGVVAAGRAAAALTAEAIYRATGTAPEPA